MIHLKQTVKHVSTQTKQRCRSFTAGSLGVCSPPPPSHCAVMWLPPTCSVATAHSYLTLPIPQKPALHRDMCIYVCVCVRVFVPVCARAQAPLWTYFCVCVCIHWYCTCLSVYLEYRSISSGACSQCTFPGRAWRPLWHGHVSAACVFDRFKVMSPSPNPGANDCDEEGAKAT